MNINFDSTSRQPKGIVAQVMAVIVGVIALGVALMFSLVFFAAVAVVGLVFWLYFWWKTRELRRKMREQVIQQRQNQDFKSGPFDPGSGGDVIEGEAVRVVDERVKLPGQDASA